MNDSEVSIVRFHRLVIDLLSAGHTISIRFRLIGEMWRPNFLNVHRVSENGAIFSDEVVKEYVFVSDLAKVIQFELDSRFQDFQPHFHYDVVGK